MAQQDQPKGAADDGRVDRIGFRCLRGSSFRVVYCDGAIGEFTPRGLFRMALYAERPALQEHGFRCVKDDGIILEPEQFIGTGGSRFDREVEVDVMMNFDTAKQLYSRPGNHLQSLEEVA